MRQRGLGGELVAECFGTFILILLGDGVVANVGLAPRLAPGAYGWDTIVFGWAFAVVIAVYVAGGVTGAHINPAVTVAFAVFRKFPWRKVVPYSLAQLAGAFVAAALVFLNYHPAFMKADPNLENLLLDPYFQKAVENAQTAWRHVVTTAIELGIPVPAFAAALAYYDSYRSDRLPANLLQAQRDYFGAHTYHRVDKPGEGPFHSDWLRLRKPTIEARRNDSGCRPQPRYRTTRKGYNRWCSGRYMSPLP